MLPRVHVPKRGLAQRRRDREAGVDAAGRPTPRSLGLSPRQLMAKYDLTMRQAVIASRELVKRAHAAHDQELRELDERRY